MATPEQCEQALHQLADRMATVDEQTRKRSSLDRTLSCRITDLDLCFAARLHDGLLSDIHRTDRATADAAQVTLAMTGDDLLALMAGQLAFASAWTAGRVKVKAGVFDLIKLRNIF